jgi:hypothetical protein
MATGTKQHQTVFYARSESTEENVSQTMQVASLLRHGLLKHFVLDPLVCLHLSDAPTPQRRFLDISNIQV